LLAELGLISYDDLNYELRGSRDECYAEQFNDLIEWLNSNSQALEEHGVQVNIRAESGKFFTGSRDLEISMDRKTDWFDLKMVVIIGEFRIPFWKFRSNILNNERRFILPDGTVFIMPREWLSRYGELFEFGLGEGEKIRLHKQHFPIAEKIQSGWSSPELRRLESLQENGELPSVQLPAGLAARLRPYQIEGYTWLYYLSQNKLGGCLADDMGLGKTLQAIAMLVKHKEMAKTRENVPALNGQLDLFDTVASPVSSSLIVVPSSVVFNWKNEIHKFAPGLKVAVHAGNLRSRNVQELIKYDVVITSYPIVRQDIGSLSLLHFEYVILDESQVIKNPSSKVYHAVSMLNSVNRLVLTGTPVENSLTDLWAQMNFVNPNLLGNLSFFKREYVSNIEKKNDKHREEKLKRIINPFILRRTKEEVARDLPEMSEQVIYCTMTDEQKQIYEEEKSGIRNALLESIDQKGIEKSSMIVLQGLTRLRQLSNHPRLTDENYRNESGKYLEVFRNIENVLAENHKVLIFSSFVKHLELIEEGLKERQIKYTMLTGETVNREEIVRVFQENENCRVFLISLKAGGVGLNLSAADYVFILDPWWNPAAEDQAVSRAHRIGQNKNVFVYRFISEGTIEEKIQKLQDKKSKLADTFINSNNPVKDISKEELEELFS